MATGEFRNLAWPLNNTGLSCVAPLTCRLFSVNVPSVLCIPGFRVHGFSQLWVETVFSICREEPAGAELAAGVTVCVILGRAYQGLERLRVSVSGGPGTHPPRRPRDGGVIIKSYAWVFDCVVRCRCPHPYGVQGSPVYAWFGSFPSLSNSLHPLLPCG